MTLDFYQLNEQPFAAGPDLRFLYMGASHRQAFAALLQALQAGRGFVTLLAKPGLGKTTLLLHTIASFGDKVATIYVPHTAQTPLDLLRSILERFGLPHNSETSEDLEARLRQKLLEEQRLGKRVIVIIDDAQNLDASVFDLLATLLKDETPRGRLIQSIFCGSPRLIEKLAASKSMQAVQRGAVVRLEPFSAHDTAQYINQRLRVAGYARPSSLFTPDAAALVALYSEGNPRAIDTLCVEALSRASACECEQVSAQVVRETAITLNLSKPKQEAGYSAPILLPVQTQISATAVLPPAIVPAEDAGVHEQSAPQPACEVKLEKIIALPAEPQPVVPLVAKQALQSPMVAATGDMIAQAEPSAPSLLVFKPRKDPQEKPLVTSWPPQAPTPPVRINPWAVLQASRRIASPSRARIAQIALRPPALLRYSGLTLAAVFLFAAIFGVHRAKIFQEPARQTLAISSLPHTAPIAAPGRLPVIPATERKPALESPGHDLKGMDIATALQALSGKSQREQRVHTTDPRP